MLFLQRHTRWNYDLVWKRDWGKRGHDWKDWKMKTLTLNVAYKIHTQRTLLEYRATIHYATRITLAWKLLMTSTRFTLMRLQDLHLCVFYTLLHLLNPIWKPLRIQKCYVLSYFVKHFCIFEKSTHFFVVLFSNVCLSFVSLVLNSPMLMAFSEIQQFVRKTSGKDDANQKSFSDVLGFPNEYFWI